MKDDILAATSSNIKVNGDADRNKAEDECSNGPAVANIGEQIMLDGKIVTSEEVEGMKKTIVDIELVNESRQKRIDEVCQFYQNLLVA